MLCLKRNHHQSIMIGKNIEVIVCSINDGHVVLGINAPNNVEVHRKEIFLKIEDNKLKGE